LRRILEDGSFNAFQIIHITTLNLYCVTLSPLSLLGNGLVARQNARIEELLDEVLTCISLFPGIFTFIYSSTILSTPLSLSSQKVGD
jgi:hypothetical protein